MTKITKAQQYYIDGYNETSNGLDGIIKINPNVCADVLEEYGIDYHAAKTFPDLRKALASAVQGKAPEFEKELLDKLYTTLHKSMEEQVPGSADVFFDAFNKFATTDSTSNDAKSALKILTGGPTTLDNQSINGKNYGFAVLPSPQLDTKEKLFNYFFRSKYSPEIVKEITNNTPGDIEKWMRYLGRHEGGHLDNHPSKDLLRGTIAEEYKADAKSMESAIAAGDTDFIRAWRAFRALRPDDDEHATSAPLLSNTPVSKVLVDVIKTFENDIYEKVSNKLDLTMHHGMTTEARDLLKENPDAFFDALSESTNEQIEKATQSYEANPTSIYAMKEAATAQVFANYARSFEDGYKRYALGLVDTPEPSPAQIIPKDKESWVFQEIEDEEDVKELATLSDWKATQLHDPANSYDWDKHGDGAKTPEDLSPDKLEQYLNWERDYLTQLHKQTEDLFISGDCSTKDLEQVIAIDHAIEYYGEIHNIAMADIGKEEQTLELAPLTSEDLRYKYYSFKYTQQHADESSKDPSTTEAKTTHPPSNVTVNFDNRTTMVGDAPVTEHFAQTADPSAPTPTTPTTDIAPDTIDTDRQATTEAPAPI